MFETIATSRLLLRPFVLEDASAMLRYLKAPKVHCFASMKLDSLEQAKERIEQLQKEQGYCFAIALKQTGEVIGEIEAHPDPVDPHGNGKEIDTWSLCWMLNEDYQKKGYAYEAASALLEEWFANRQARRIYAYTEIDNLPSQALCQKLGMRKEGVFEDFVTFINHPDGTPLYETTLQFAVLKREWEAKK